MIRFVLCFLAAATLAACSKAPSTDVKTGSIVATYEVNADTATQATCTAKFQVGGSTGTFLDLGGGDSVTCNGYPMSRSEIFNIITYSATVPTPPGGLYKIVFQRPSESYDATTTVPEQIFNASPAAGTSFQKGTSIPVSWQTAADPSVTMTAILTYDYAAGPETRHASYYREDTAPENGLLSFAGSDTQVSPPVPGAWAAHLTLERIRYGNMPTGLGGSINGSRRLVIPITLRD